MIYQLLTIPEHDNFRYTSRALAVPEFHNFKKIRHEHNHIQSFATILPVRRMQRTADTSDDQEQYEKVVCENQLLTETLEMLNLESFLKIQRDIHDQYAAAVNVLTVQKQAMLGETTSVEPNETSTLHHLMHDLLNQVCLDHVYQQLDNQLLETQELGAEVQACQVVESRLKSEYEALNEFKDLEKQILEDQVVELTQASQRQTRQLSDEICALKTQLRVQHESLTDVISRQSLELAQVRQELNEIQLKATEAQAKLQTTQAKCVVQDVETQTESIQQPGEVTAASMINLTRKFALKQYMDQQHLKQRCSDLLEQQQDPPYSSDNTMVEQFRALLSM